MQVGCNNGLDGVPAARPGGADRPGLRGGDRLRGPGLVQYLSAKLGLVTGRSLPELPRDRLPRGTRLLYWAQAEIVAIATDLAEALGGAIALRILFGLPLLLGGIVTGAVSTALLAVQNRAGQRPFERVITARRRPS